MEIQDIFKKYNTLPQNDLVSILEFLLKINKEQLFTKPALGLNEEKMHELDELINRYKKEEPLAYITGFKYFYESKFWVNSSVLIPRPETEMLVDYAIDFISKSRQNMLNILEIGTGSGCIAISILKKLVNIKSNKKVTILATDISTEALKMADKNAKNILSPTSYNSLKLVEADILPQVTKNKFDLIISNPPYIPSQTIKMLAKSVEKYEPATALDGGKTGINIYKSIIEKTKSHWHKDTEILFEVDETSLKALKFYLNERKFRYKIIEDLYKRPRLATINMVL